MDLFERDTSRSPYNTPQRALALAYVHGLAPRPEYPGTCAAYLSLIPGLGELIVVPALTISGPCDILTWEALPGGPLDIFSPDSSADKHLRLLLDLMRRHAPWEYERCAKVELTDPRASLVGRYAPVVRRPVAQLPSGGIVLGMADAVVANDPITGQGSNNAARFAATYLSAITSHGEQPFDRDFMQHTFELAWKKVATCTAWTNAMLAPPAPHVLDAISAAGANQDIGNRFANGFSNPDDFAWLLDPALTAAYLAASRSGREA